MTSNSLEQLINQLDEAKRRFGSNGAEVHELLAAIARRRFSDPELLIRFHEQLLFIRAYPPGRSVLQLAEKILAKFQGRVARMLASGVDPATFDYIENSGIAGTVLHGHYSYGVARWLAQRYPDRVEIDWERFQNKERLATVLPRLIPLLEEDSLVEQNIPYLAWLSAASGRGIKGAALQGKMTERFKQYYGRGERLEVTALSKRRGRRRGSDLGFLIERFEQLGVSEKERSALYDSLELWIRWDLGESDASRTNNRHLPRKVFYHKAPLIRRAEVSVADQISAPLRLQALPLERGQVIINRCRKTSCVRYRELYGIAYGDPSGVVRAQVGRGVEIYLWGLPPDRRLPLRAYHAGFTIKNGIPINYIEGITIFERMEIGFNTFYTYRDGETAWVYAQILRMLHHLTGARCFSIDPYQIGLNNDEAIESGAFWFYRKLGFRPTRAALIKIAQAEEKKIAAGRGHRTSTRILRRLAEAPMVYEMGYRGAKGEDGQANSSPPGSSQVSGDWDNFKIRNLGLAVARRAATKFRGNLETHRAAAIRRVAGELGMRTCHENTRGWKLGRPENGRPYELFSRFQGAEGGVFDSNLKDGERRAVENLALVLDLIPDLSEWSDAEKKKAAAIIRAKWRRDDAAYARLLQSHPRLRRAIIKIGSKIGSD
jgi:hypothetical protein